MELIPRVVNIAVCNVLSNILRCMLSISIAVITSLHCALFLYLKNFFHSYHSMLCSFLTIKKEVFNDMQHVYELTPLKIIKVCTTWWLTHGEACLRIIRIWAIDGCVGCNLQWKKMPRCERGQRCSLTATKYLYAFTCCRVIGNNQLLLQVLTNKKFKLFFHQEQVRERYWAFKTFSRRIRRLWCKD